MEIFTEICFTSIFLWPLQWSMKFISEVSCCIRYKIRNKGYNWYIADGSKVEYPQALLILYAEVHSLTAETQNAHIKSCYHHTLSVCLLWDQVPVWGAVKYKLVELHMPCEQGSPNLMSYYWSILVSKSPISCFFCPGRFCVCLPF